MSTSDASNEVIDQALAACSMDFSDVLYYSNPNACGGFKKVAEERRSSIAVYSRPVASSPINMMRATVVMPCSPAEFVRYMEPDARVLWDEYYKYGKLIRRVRPAVLSTPLSAQEESKRPQSTPTATATRSNTTASVSSSSTSSSTASSLSPPSPADYPQLKIFEFNSPVPSLVRSRDFEMVMCQHVNSTDGTALVKGFSTPKGYLLPLRYKKGSEAEGRRADVLAKGQRVARFREAMGVDITSMGTPSMQKLLSNAKTVVEQREKKLPTNLTPPSHLDEATLPGLVGVPAFDTSSLESTVRGTIVFSGFVATPIFENDRDTLESLPAETQRMIADAKRNRDAAGPLPTQSELFAYPYVASVEGKGKIIASRVTYVALIQPQGNVHPMFVNIVVRMQTKGLKHMQRAIIAHPVKILDEKLLREKGSTASGDTYGGILSSKL